MIGEVVREDVMVEEEAEEGTKANRQRDDPPKNDSLSKSPLTSMLRLKRTNRRIGRLLRGYRRQDQ